MGGKEPVSSVLDGPPLSDVEDTDGGPEAFGAHADESSADCDAVALGPQLLADRGADLRALRKGALGIVLNKPLPMRLSDVLTQMKLEPTSESIAELPVLRGGPVNTDRGFVLHRPGGKWDHTHKVSETIQVTTLATCWRRWRVGMVLRMPSSPLAMLAGRRGSWRRRCGRMPG